MSIEIEELNDKLDIIKESFEEIMEVLQDLDIKQKAIADILIIRDIVKKGEVDFIAEAIRDNM